MIFPREKVSIGSCLLPVPLDRYGRPRRKYPSIEKATGYRIICVDGERWPAHRLSYCLNVGQIPVHPEGGKSASEGLVLHTCDNKWCINPEHLYLGSKSQNTLDLVERNKSWMGKRKHSQEVRAKISKNTREAMSKIKNPWLGRKHSEESKKKMSHSSKRKGAI